MQLTAKQSNQPLRVAIITKYWKNSPGGGIKTYLVNMVDYLEKGNADVKVIFNQGLDPHQIKVNGNKLLFSIKVFFTLRCIRPTVIHSQAYWYCLLPGVIYKQIYGCKLIHTFRSEPDSKMPWLYSFFLSLLTNRCNYITFVSQGLYNIIQESYGLRIKNPIITYPGVAIKDVSDKEISDFKSMYNINDGDIVLLIQGFTANKIKSDGIKLVINSMSYLVTKYSNIKLIITRDGKYLQELKKYSHEYMLDSNVIYTGNLSNPFIPIYLCDIFLFPWLGKSGVGNALLEAMSVGKPIIATSVNGQGVSEIIINKKNGILVEPDSDVIAETIELLLNNKNLSTMISENAKKDAKNKYSWENCVTTFLRLYS